MRTNQPSGGVSSRAERSQGRRQKRLCSGAAPRFLRSRPAVVGTAKLHSRGGQMSPAAEPAPLLGHVGWRLELGTLVDGLSKSVLRLHSFSVRLFTTQCQVTR